MNEMIYFLVYLSGLFIIIPFVARRYYNINF